MKWIKETSIIDLVWEAWHTQSPSSYTHIPTTQRNRNWPEGSINKATKQDDKKRDTFFKNRTKLMNLRNSSKVWIWVVHREGSRHRLVFLTIKKNRIKALHAWNCRHLCGGGIITICQSWKGKSGSREVKFCSQQAMEETGSPNFSAPYEPDLLVFVC